VGLNLKGQHSEHLNQLLFYQ